MQSVLMVLEEAGILSSISNRQSLAPTLQYDYKPLFGSIECCGFVEDAYPDHGSKLLPSNPYEKAKPTIRIEPNSKQQLYIDICSI